MLPVKTTPESGGESRNVSLGEPNQSLPYEHILSLLVEGIKDYAIFLLTPEGMVASWNQGAERLKLYQKSEIIGRHFSIFYSSDDVKSGKPEMELAGARAVGRFEDEGWRIRKDGSRFWANVILTAVHDESGKLIGFGKITRDVTDRRESELRYRLLIDGVTDYAIYSLDKVGNIVSWNVGAERIKQYRSEEIIGKNFSTLYMQEDVEAGLPQKALVEASSSGHYNAEGWRLRKDGTKFWSSVTITAIRDEAGNLIGFSKITRDITDKQELRLKISRHAEELETRIAERDRTNAELEAFSYTVSHDLRSPLRAIEGFADIILTDFAGQLPAQVVENLQYIVRSAERMNRLVRDLLSYSRLNQIELKSAPISVAEAIDGARDQLDHDLRDKVIVSADPELTIWGNLPTLTQALYNVISNGLKFYPPGTAPHVEVAAHKKGENVVISIRDEGIGIAPQHKERIFQVFQRLHTADTYPGTGIGLSIVRRGINRLGGTVELESAPGVGSTFCISLKAA